MNREKIIIELSRISTPTGTTPYGDITLDDYTCDEILDYITEQEDENANLKQALNEIRKYTKQEINDCLKKAGPFVRADTNQKYKCLNDILKITDKYK